VKTPTTIRGLAAVFALVAVLTGAAKCDTASGGTTYVENGTRNSTADMLVCRQVGSEATAKLLVKNREGDQETFHIQVSFESISAGVYHAVDRNVLVGKASTNYLGVGAVLDRNYDDLKCVVTRFYAVHGG